MTVHQRAGPMTAAPVGLRHFGRTLRHKDYVGTAIYLAAPNFGFNVVTDGMGDMQVLAQMKVGTLEIV
jgi:hypothetical protein